MCALKCYEISEHINLVLNQYGVHLKHRILLRATSALNTCW